MAYPYNPKIAPAIGNGLGGFPQKATGGTTSDPRGEITFPIPGTYTWIPPVGVTSFCIVCVGGGGGGNRGGGGGGALAYANDISYSSIMGEISIMVGSGGTQGNSDASPAINPTSGTESYVIVNGNYVVRANGGGSGRVTGYAYGGSVVNGVGGAGGDALYSIINAGAGAGGYAGKGGNCLSSSVEPPVTGSGAGATGKANFGGGGGVGLYGLGSDGASNGGGGSGGQNGFLPADNGNGYGVGGAGGSFGGGGGGSSRGGGCGGNGAVRIIWGKGRAFPSTDCGQS